MKRIVVIIIIVLSGALPLFAHSGLSGHYVTVQGHKEYYKVPSEKEHYISPTHYDYSGVANSITKGCKSDYEKIRAIYYWICENIRYDTSYVINTADECYDAKKGVCQGYCELFYRIAEAVKVRVEIISGISRDYKGRVHTGGHAWLFAYTRPNYGILLDPCWGAGTVNGDTFTFNKIHDFWFNVEPEWMILRHFPNDESYQLLKHPLTRAEFDSMDYSFSLLNEYGFDVHQVFAKARAHNLTLPEVYSGGVGDFIIISAPLQEKLISGETYEMKVRVTSNRDLVLVNGRGLAVSSGAWTVEGEGVYSIKFTPGDNDEVILGFQEVDGWKTSYSYCVVYSVGRAS